MRMQSKQIEAKSKLEWKAIDDEGGDVTFVREVGVPFDYRGNQCEQV